MPKRQRIDASRVAKTFGERQRESVEDTLPPISPPAPAPVVPERQGPASSSPARDAKPARASKSGKSAAYFAVHLPRTEFQDAKAAYLADWQAGGEASSFTEWVAAAVGAHVSRTPSARAALDLGEGGADRVTRTFQVGPEAVNQMRMAVSADRDANRWTSESQWIREAIAAAVQDAKVRSGGPLPTPPRRLPNRLRRA